MLILLESTFRWLFCVKFSFKSLTFSKNYARKHKWLFFPEDSVLVKFLFSCYHIPLVNKTEYRNRWSGYFSLVFLGPWQCWSLLIYGGSQMRWPHNYSQWLLPPETCRFATPTTNIYTSVGPNWRPESSPVSGGPAADRQRTGGGASVRQKPRRAGCVASAAVE